MTKTGKFLYGGFAIVALAGIVAMLVSIFSSPKQIAGENVETPIQPQLNKQKMETASPINKPTIPDGYVAFYLNENGNKVWFTQEQRGRLELYPERIKTARN